MRACTSQPTNVCSWTFFLFGHTVAIYGFRGGDARALEKEACVLRRVELDGNPNLTDLSPVRMRMDESQRFGTIIAAVPNTIDFIEASITDSVAQMTVGASEDPGVLTSEPFPSTRLGVKQFTVIAKTNAELFMYFIAFLLDSQNVKVAINGTGNASGMYVAPNVLFWLV